MLPDIIRRLFPRRDAEKRVLITGLGYTGKTTLLYRLCLGDVVTTIPTIGFNVESVRAPTSGGRPPLALNCWDVSGGCGRIQPLLQYYVAGTEALVWIIDSNERNYMAEVIEELRGTLGLVDENTRGDPIPCLILANKQDLPGAMGLDEIRMKLAPAISTRPSCAIFPTSLVTDAFFTTLTPAMDWLYDALNGIEPPQLTLDKPAPETLINPLAEKLMSWVERASKDMPTEYFLKAFEDISLPSWDHYTHIRIAYTVLKTYGRQKGKTMIFDGLERYIKFSSQTTGRTFHVTMTYFWVQIVHFGIQSMPHAHSVKDDTENKEFSRFLLLNPYVADGNLWADYYSKDVIMTPNAKQQMVLPDKKPLPSLIARDSIRR